MLSGEFYSETYLESVNRKILIDEYIDEEMSKKLFRKLFHCAPISLMTSAI
jgi:hypothetical protein